MGGIFNLGLQQVGQFNYKNDSVVSILAANDIFDPVILRAWQINYLASPLVGGSNQLFTQDGTGTCYGRRTAGVGNLRIGLAQFFTSIGWDDSIGQTLVFNNASWTFDIDFTGNVTIGDETDPVTLLAYIAYNDDGATVGEIQFPYFNLLYDKQGTINFTRL
jgi:hypothetical protein